MSHSKSKKTDGAMGKTTLIQCRVPIFSPTTKPTTRVECSATMQTTVGNANVTVTGRLGQVHQSLLDALPIISVERFNGQTVLDGHGQLHYKFEMHALRRALGQYDRQKQKRGRDERKGHKSVERLLEDLEEAKLIVDVPGWQIRDRIIAQQRVATGDNWGVDSMGNKRRPRVVSLTKIWSDLCLRDLPLYYNLHAVLALRSGYSQAVARLLLSHDAARYKPTYLQTLFTQLGVPESCSERWNATSRVKEDAKKGLFAPLGLVLGEDGKMHREAISKGGCLSQNPGGLSQNTGYLSQNPSGLSQNTGKTGVL